MLSKINRAYGVYLLSYPRHHLNELVCINVGSGIIGAHFAEIMKKKTGHQRMSRIARERNQCFLFFTWLRERRPCLARRECQWWYITLSSCLRLLSSRHNEKAASPSGMRIDVAAAGAYRVVKKLHHLFLAVIKVIPNQ